MALDKKAILRHAGSFKAREVHVPAWRDADGDDVVLVRGMTIREFEINQSRSGDGESAASIVSRCVVDDTGGRLFSDSDISMIAELPLAQMNVLIEAIAEASGVGEDNPEQAIKVAVTRAEGNSGTPTASSTSPTSSSATD